MKLVILLVITAVVACYGRPMLSKTRATSRHRNWEDFFLIDPTLEEKDFNIDEIWNRNDIAASSEGWSDCGSSSIIQVQSIEIYPNPPQKGQTFSVTAKVYLSEEVNSGSSSIYIIYNKMVPIIKTTMKVCNLVGYFGESCPVSAGSHTVVYSQTFPSYAVSGRYTGKVKAADSSGNELVCIDIDMSI